MKILLLGPYIWLMGLLVQQAKPLVAYTPLLSQGYWRCTTYKRGANPNLDSTFIPVEYVYSYGMKYNTRSTGDEDRPVVIVPQLNGTEKLKGVTFECQTMHKCEVYYRKHQFFIGKKGKEYYLTAKGLGTTTEMRLVRDHTR